MIVQVFCTEMLDWIYWMGQLLHSKKCEYCWLGCPILFNIYVFPPTSNACKILMGKTYNAAFFFLFQTLTIVHRYLMRFKRTTKILQKCESRHIFMLILYFCRDVNKSFVSE